MHVRSITSSDIIFESISLIENYGWTQGDFESDDGYCIMGAALRARAIFQEIFPEAPQTVDEAAAEALQKIRAVTDSLVKFNDTPGRKKEEVLNALRDSVRV